MKKYRSVIDFLKNEDHKGGNLPPGNIEDGVEVVRKRKEKAEEKLGY